MYTCNQWSNGFIWRVLRSFCCSGKRISTGYSPKLQPGTGYPTQLQPGTGYLPQQQPGTGYSPQQPGSTGYPTQQQNPRYPPAYPGVENVSYPPQQQQNRGYPPAYGTGDYFQYWT